MIDANLSFVALVQNKKQKTLRKSKSLIYGTPEGIRTPDLLVRSQTLYPAELLAQILVVISTTFI